MSCFGVGEEIFYGTRMVPVWYQSSAGVVAGLEGREPLAQLLQMLMLRDGPKLPKATQPPYVFSNASPTRPRLSPAGDMHPTPNPSGIGPFLFAPPADLLTLRAGLLQLQRQIAT